MAPSVLKTVPLLSTLTLTLTLITSPTTTARPLPEPTRTALLTRHLGLPEPTPTRENSTATSCWDSVFELQACTGEVIQFFYNGEAFLGPECCHAVHVIVHDCWPDVLASLGFTAQEGRILTGYCDAAEEQRPGPPKDAVGPTKKHHTVSD